PHLAGKEARQAGWCLRRAVEGQEGDRLAVGILAIEPLVARGHVVPFSVMLAQELQDDGDVAWACASHQRSLLLRGLELLDGFHPPLPLSFQCLARTARIASRGRGRRATSARGGFGMTWSRKAPGHPVRPSMAAMAMLNISRAVT